MARMLVPVLLCVIGSAVLLGTPARAAPAYDSLYQFESAFLGDLKQGDSGMFSVFFFNTGATAWVAGTASQVNLAICGSDKITCNITSPNAAWNPGTWLSEKAYATHGKGTVSPGDSSAFTYRVVVPASAAGGTYLFNGDLVLASSGAKLHPEGYFHSATVGATAPGSPAPADVQVQVANLDGGPKNDDVRVFFTAPTTNPVMAYDVQRAPSHCQISNDSPFWLTVQTLSLSGGAFGSYNDLDRPSGFWCYQVRVARSTSFAYSQQVEAAVFGTANPFAISTSALLTRDASIVGTLDAGDQFSIAFDRAMSISAGARIRLVDADCGAPGSQSSPPANCSPSLSQTTAEVICGTNATCTLSLDGTTVLVSMTATPLEITAGSTPGAQFPLDIVSSAGIQDPAGNAWSIITSPDRVIGPQGQ